MKRSEINRIIKDAIEFFELMNFKLPRWAYWGPGKWIEESRRVKNISELMLGWDLTDFGGNDFKNKGLILFTLRNGDLDESVNSKRYAEKIMIVGENQETPMHFHWAKTEDIINRGGGNLVLEICGSTEDEKISSLPVQVKVDEISQEVEPFGRIVLSPGESICLEPRVYHRFHGEEGKGRVLVGEVSSVNDDKADNRFYKDEGRFPDIEEDEEAAYLLVNDYSNYLV